MMSLYSSSSDLLKFTGFARHVPDISQASIKKEIFMVMALVVFKFIVDGYFLGFRGILGFLI